MPGLLYLGLQLLHEEGTRHAPHSPSGSPCICTRMFLILIQGKPYSALGAAINTVWHSNSYATLVGIIAFGEHPVYEYIKFTSKNQAFPRLVINSLLV